MRDAASLMWPDLFFAQGHYRFQYKRPAQKKSDALPLAYLCQPPSGVLEPYKCRTSIAFFTDSYIASYIFCSNYPASYIAS